MTQRVSGPSRKATLSLICLAEASRLDLASPAYSRPSTVTLHDIIMKHLLLPHDPSQNHCVYPASPLRPPCVLRPRLVTPASRVTLCSPAFSCIPLRSPVTGGKGPNNQWAHAKYIENPVNK